MAFDIQRAFQHVIWEGDDQRRQPLLVAELALWSAMSDGVLEEHEIVTIVDAIRQIPALAEFTRQEATALLRRMFEAFQEEEKMIERIHEVSRGISLAPLRRLAFQLAVYCAASDGMFTDAESQFLRGLQEEFEIPEGEASRLIDEVIN